MTSPNSGSFAVDGSGQILRPGNQVQIFRTNLSEPCSGRVVSLDRWLMRAEVDTGAAETMDIAISRLALDDDSEPIWVLGSL